MKAKDSWVKVLLISLWASTVGTLTIWSLDDQRARTALGDEAALSFAAAMFRNGTVIVVVVASGILLAQGLMSNRGKGLGMAVFVLLPWTISFVANIPSGGFYAGMGLLIPIFTLALGASRPSVDLVRWVAALCGVTLVISVILTRIVPQTALATDYLGAFLVVDKAMTPWGLLQGMFTSANNLGQFAALSLPLLFLVSKPLLRWPLIGGCAGVLVWSSSRGALIAAAASVVMLMVLWMIRRRPRLRAPMIWICTIGIAAVVAGLPLLAWPDDAFSGRGRIWRFVLSEAMNVFPFGLGPGWFDYMGSITNSLGRDAFHGHNQFVHLVATGGLLLTLAVGFVLIVAIRRTTRLAPELGNPLAAYVVALLGTGLLEVSIGYVDRANFMFVVALPVALIILCRDDVKSETKLARQTEPGHSLSGRTGAEVGIRTRIPPDRYAVSERDRSPNGGAEASGGGVSPANYH